MFKNGKIQGYLFFTLIVGIGLFVKSCSGCSSTDKPADPVDPLKELAKTPANMQFDKNDGSHIALTNWIKRKNDGDFKHLTTSHEVRGDTVYVIEKYEIDNKLDSAYGIFSATDGSMLNIIVNSNKSK